MNFGHLTDACSSEAPVDTMKGLRSAIECAHYSLTRYGTSYTYKFLNDLCEIYMLASITKDCDAAETTSIYSAYNPSTNDLPISQGVCSDPFIMFPDSLHLVISKLFP